MGKCFVAFAKSFVVATARATCGAAERQISLHYTSHLSLAFVADTFVVAQVAHSFHLSFELCSCGQTLENHLLERPVLEIWWKWHIFQCINIRATVFVANNNRPSTHCKLTHSYVGIGYLLLSVIIIGVAVNAMCGCRLQAIRFQIPNRQLRTCCRYQNR